MKNVSSLAYGEVLFDIYGEKAVIGGAPLNFAAHMAKLGARSYVLSAVGNDSLGDDAVKFIRACGVSDVFLHKTDAPTGVCKVTLSDTGLPSYELCRNVSYDKIYVTADEIDTIKREKFDIFYFGTLALREKKSFDTLKELLANCRDSFREVFFDVNIRQNFYSREVVEFGLRSCTTIKVSREEADVFAKLGIFDVSLSGEEYLRGLCVFLCREYGIGRVLLTLDSDGAFVYSASEGKFTNQAAVKTEVVSSVGAGDSFSAAFTYASLCGKSDRDALALGTEISGFVVGKVEAIPEYDETIIKKITDC